MAIPPCIKCPYNIDTRQYPSKLIEFISQSLHQCSPKQITSNNLSVAIILISSTLFTKFWIFQYNILNKGLHELVSFTFNLIKVLCQKLLFSNLDIVNGLTILVGAGESTPWKGEEGVKSQVSTLELGGCTFIAVVLLPTENLQPFPKFWLLSTEHLNWTSQVIVFESIEQNFLLADLL